MLRFLIPKVTPIVSFSLIVDVFDVEVSALEPEVMEFAFYFQKRL
jgi:hypothetical protein